MNNQVFRKVSMERLSSPEQLDTLVKVTSPRGWLALIGIALLLATAIYWGIFGSLSVKVNSQGVLIRPGGLQGIYAGSNGPITDLRVSEHDKVNKGDVIARVGQPELLELMKTTKANIAKASAALKESPDPKIKSELESLQSSLVNLLDEYENSSKIVSPYSGRVLEVKVNKGNYVDSGTAIVTIETNGATMKELEAVLYVPADQGKKLLPGMDVQLSPSSVNREEYGFMIGRVISVSEFPATQQGMMIKLGNEGLVQQMAAQGVALEVRVDLVPDNRTFSGYAWSTADGPPSVINSGTLVNGSITVSKQRPIASVIPQFK
ncbi:NHLP bacteriocin system secretion protein [Paenibacillus eucommiae]|uniref:Multidrug efflux pump subunit AcrA (Membrane-fusion protein) n=1 Tax=Paenibacillus eucommiae TaxID=1355755 RepID=A0ABS4IQY8_9BACL|nr:NHLP bacteriocin system secretion protein [Paenibacillus eucommiae]MBP1989991.1 multidrug efflux pump subunit AcrA (membrane-fusion protein) [Paenibacillus eucommiae]